MLLTCEPVSESHSNISTMVLLSGTHEYLCTIKSITVIYCCRTPLRTLNTSKRRQVTTLTLSSMADFTDQKQRSYVRIDAESWENTWILTSILNIYILGFSRISGLLQHPLDRILYLALYLLYVVGCGRILEYWPLYIEYLYTRPTQDIRFTPPPPR